MLKDLVAFAICIIVGMTLGLIQQKNLASSEILNEWMLALMLLLALCIVAIAKFNEIIKIIKESKLVQEMKKGRPD